jgi:hypothetical protein
VALVRPCQGDQIGRIFASWFTVFTLDSFCENYRSSTGNWATSLHGKIAVLIIAKNGLGYILGDFFTNASGHPGPCPQSLSSSTYVGSTYVCRKCQMRTAVLRLLQRYGTQVARFFGTTYQNVKIAK